MPYSDQVDAEPARQHVKALLAGGMSLSQIQFASGVNRTAIQVMLGEHPGRSASMQIRQGTAEKLLRTRLNRGVSIDGLVPAAGTRRRIEALVAIGYPKRDLAKRLGVTQIQTARVPLMRAEWAQQVMALYEDLRDIPGPSSRARETARRRGWLPPIWWDDDSIDDPQAQPEGTRSYRGTVLIDDVTLPRPVRVALMTKRGLSEAEIAQRIGTIKRYVTRDLLERPVTRLPVLEGKAATTAELDEVAVDRLMAGTLRHTEFHTSPELAEAVRRLVALGWSDGAIETRLGRAPNTLAVFRKRNGIPAAMPTGRTA
jgi:transcriptional regulator with XRE-family HTH domain